MDNDINNYASRLSYTQLSSVHTCSVCLAVKVTLISCIESCDSGTIGITVFEFQVIENNIVLKNLEIFAKYIQGIPVSYTSQVKEKQNITKRLEAV